MYQTAAYTDSFVSQATAGARLLRLSSRRDLCFRRNTSSSEFSKVPTNSPFLPAESTNMPRQLLLETSTKYLEPSYESAPTISTLLFLLLLFRATVYLRVRVTNRLVTFNRSERSSPERINRGLLGRKESWLARISHRNFNYVIAIARVFERCK